VYSTRENTGFETSHIVPSTAKEMIPTRKAIDAHAQYSLMNNDLLLSTFKM